MRLTNQCSGGINKHHKLYISRKITMRSIQIFFICFILAAFSLTACSPTVKVAAPDKPITINLNVKIQHEIKIKVEKELDDIFSEDSGLF